MRVLVRALVKMEQRTQSEFSTSLHPLRSVMPVQNGCETAAEGQWWQLAQLGVVSQGAGWWKTRPCEFYPPGRSLVAAGHTSDAHQKYYASAGLQM